MSALHETHLESRVKAVWRREQHLRFTEGALAFVRWGLVLFLAGGFMDWMMSRWLFADLPAAGRSVLLLVVLGVPLYKAWHAGWKSIRPFNATYAALQIEAQKGGMESLLVTGIQLKEQMVASGLSGAVTESLVPGVSDALCDLTCRKAEESAGEIDPKDSVRFQSLRRPAMIALIVALFFGVLAVTNGPLLLAGLGRIFAPWLAITYPTRTRLEMVKTDLVVQEGKPVRIAARVLGVVPREAKISLRTGSGRPRVRKLPIVNGQCEYLIETAYRGFKYRLTAGDARGPWQAVEVVSAPDIEQAEVRLEFPAYTKRPPETVKALTVTVPETTRVKWTLSLDRAVRGATMNLAGEKPKPVEISEDGLTVKTECVAAESRAYSFSWVEREHGFAFTSPNQYLQVSPDRPPRVELISPKRNVYATLGRKLDLAFRGRDDHGIGESVICYRVDKREENRLRFTPAKPIDGTEQVIDWDYRSVLPNITVGQTVTFVVELADSYPGEEGPHRVRSEARRMQFMSMEDYLAKVEKQRQRLLSRLRATYREEREVHEAVMRLDRSDPVFVQTCQLEAVRQDMVREGLNKLAGQVLDLTEDMTANGVTNQSLIASLVQLRSSLQGISAGHVSGAAKALRALAGESAYKGDSVSAQADAVHMVNGSARELGLLVLQLGFRDAAEVMAREMHAAAQTQASLRLRTLMSKGDTAQLAEAQVRLMTWISRLLAASPKGKESTIDDALIEFSLTRMVKHLINGGIVARLQEATTLIGDKKPAEAARLQSEAIAALLKAEFRLRLGAEHEALANAMKLFESQAGDLKKLRLEMQTLDAKTFQKRHASLAAAQAALHGNLQLLLMPEIPARRARLFDDAVPVPPAVADLLAATDAAMAQAVAHVEKGDRAAAEKAQSKAESSFRELVDIANKRIGEMMLAARMGRYAWGFTKIGERLERFGERQLILLEKTEDAAAKGTKSEYLVAMQGNLAEDVERLGTDLAGRIRTCPIPSAFSLSLPARMDETLQAMRKADPLLKGNKPGEAVKHQKAAIAALAGAEKLLAEHAENIGLYAEMLGQARDAVAPSPYVQEIEEEQRDMLGLTRKTKPGDLPNLAIPQKNLVHAVDAMLNSLDVLAHRVESGTVMLFAKDDMDEAGIALEEKDAEEALDAQNYIVETLGELRGKVDAVTPQYLYVLEVVEAMHETFQEGVLIREAQRKLREKVSAKAAGAADLAKEQGALKARAEAYSKLVNEITGLGVIVPSAAHMADAEKQLKGGTPAAAADRMSQAEQALQADAGTVLKAMECVIQLLAAPILDGELPPGFVLLNEILVTAARQKVLYRESFAVKPQTLKGYEPKLREIEKACGSFMARQKQLRKPVAEEPVAEEAGRGKAPEFVPPANLYLRLGAAQGHLARAAAGAKASDRTKVVTEQKMAAASLRQFIVTRALDFYTPPAGPAPPAPGSSDQAVETDSDDLIFLPGMVSGKRPPDGKLDWEVLGKRDRAALNENFARELPLEYRAILKDYYERLAR